MVDPPPQSWWRSPAAVRAAQSLRQHCDPACGTGQRRGSSCGESLPSRLRSRRSKRSVTVGTWADAKCADARMTAIKGSDWRVGFIGTFHLFRSRFRLIRLPLYPGSTRQGCRPEELVRPKQSLASGLLIARCLNYSTRVSINVRKFMTCDPGMSTASNFSVPAPSFRLITPSVIRPQSFVYDSFRLTRSSSIPLSGGS